MSLPLNTVVFYEGGRHCRRLSFLVLTSYRTTMAIWNVLGLAVLIVVLRVYAPEIWDALEYVTLSLLGSLAALADEMQAAAGASVLPPTF